MAATAITSTPQDIQGNFDLAVTGVGAKTVLLQRSLGSGTTNWKTIKSYSRIEASEVVANVGLNSFRLAEDVAGVTVEFNQ